MSFASEMRYGQLALAVVAVALCVAIEAPRQGRRTSFGISRIDSGPRLPIFTVKAKGRQGRADRKSVV